MLTHPESIDTPDMAKPSMVYNAKQLELGKQRMRDIGRKPAAPFTKKKVRPNTRLVIV